ncbi:MAG: YkgJ family cysteine cluster protein [Sedimentisphaerales bacterium]|nr:YkgJ family cysteine cluster protein [Sedimentisphaerales bacterium]
MNKWYENGLMFICSGCGQCCSGPEEGYVWINQNEIKAMAAFLNLDIDVFKARYLHRVGRRYSLIEKEDNKDCVFLVPNGAGKKCMVYYVRPTQCRTWPFWKENIRNEQCWNHAGEKCPGINQGKWFSKTQIEALQKGDHSVLEDNTSLEQALTWIFSHYDSQTPLSAIRQLYEEIDRNLSALEPTCKNCGCCCDFERYGHRLYATTLEMLYFIHGVRTLQANGFRLPENRSGCPFRQEQGAGCLVRRYRTVGCRIYYCEDVPCEFQHELSEKVLRRLKVLHEKFGADYYYAPLPDWLPAILTITPE